jgi:hypothetical protein
MKCMQCPNHNVQHDPSENPSDSPTTATETSLRPSIYQCGVASLWSLAAVEGTETHYIYMKMIWHEYEVYAVPDPSETPDSPTAATFYFYCDFETKHISTTLSDWGCILMTISSSSRWWNTLYIYDKELIWVWSVIITYHTAWSKSDQEILLLLPLRLWYQVDIRLGLHPYDHWPQ